MSCPGKVFLFKVVDLPPSVCCGQSSFTLTSSGSEPGFYITKQRFFIRLCALPEVMWMIEATKKFRLTGTDGGGGITRLNWEMP